MSEHRLIHGSCEDVLEKITVPATGDYWHTIFADPPDNLDLGYDVYDDNMHPDDYLCKIHGWLMQFINRADTVWFSFNVKYVSALGVIVREITRNSCRNIEE
jgi:DNA modification methylase